MFRLLCRSNRQTKDPKPWKSCLTTIEPPSKMLWKMLSSPSVPCIRLPTPKTRRQWGPTSKNFMKTKTLLAMGLCAAIGLFFTQTLLAQEHKEHSDHKAHEKVKVPDNLNGIWDEI